MHRGTRAPRSLRRATVLLLAPAVIASGVLVSIPVSAAAAPVVLSPITRPVLPGPEFVPVVSTATPPPSEQPVVLEPEIIYITVPITVPAPSVNPGGTSNCVLKNVDAAPANADGTSSSTSSSSTLVCGPGTVGPTTIGSAPTTPTPTPTPTGASIFAANAVPTNAAWADPDAVQVGVRFTSSVAGKITGIRFYKGTGNGGTHQVYLWNAAGQQLATATAVNETATGWQTVTFATPVSIVAGTVYRASYYAPQGRYAVNINGLSTAVTNSPLSTVATGGAYVYGTTAPTNYVAHNYWVDVNFTASS